MPDRITIAHLLRPQGRKGELLAELLTDFPDRLPGRAVQVGPEGKSTEQTIESYFLPVGRNAGRVVLKFAGIDSINDAEKFNGLDVTIPHEERAPLEEGAAYISDLVGCTVYAEEHSIGIVVDVEGPAEASVADLPSTLIVESASGDEHMIPFVKAYIESIDTVEKRIVMRLPEGLLDING